MNAENDMSLPDKIVAAVKSIHETPGDQFRHRLSTFINALIEKDFNALVQLLYRIDVNEKKLKGLLNQHEDKDASSIIADLIIERQMQKMETKKQFRDKGEVSNEEAW